MATFEPETKYALLNVTKYHLVYGKGKTKEEREAYVPDPSLFIKAPFFTKSYPNLVVLNICGWNGDNNAFLHLWLGLPKLETLSIDDCSGLSDFGFIGEDGIKPAFWNLEKLETFILNLEYMPLITDVFFKHVLAQMPLQEFNLKSESPLTNVTSDGIMSLKKGKFGESIKKCPFDTFKLSGSEVDVSEFWGIKSVFQLN